MPDWKSSFVREDQSILQVLEHMDRAGRGIAFVVDDDQRLMATVTDGDIRRAILAGLDLSLPVREALALKSRVARAEPVVATADMKPADIVRLMSRHRVRHVPIVDDAGRVIDVAFLNDLLAENEPQMTAVVMAGGFGVRLKPLTDQVPKPLLRVGERPILEHIVGQLRDAGVDTVNIATHYRSEQIVAHFGDGTEFGVKINYLEEDRPLGTAGALSRHSDQGQPILVINGDLLTRMDYRAMLHFHLDHDAKMTVAVRSYDVEVPFGVVETEGVLVTGIKEKPTLQQFVSAGIYLLEPDVTRLIPADKAFHMPQLIDTLLAEGERVVSFPIREYWRDIGTHADYQRANVDVGRWK